MGKWFDAIYVIYRVAIAPHRAHKVEIFSTEETYSPHLQRLGICRARAHWAGGWARVANGEAL